MRRLAYIIFFCITLLAAAGLCLSYLSVYVSPERVWVLSFFGLLFVPLLLANIALLIFWIVFRKKILLLPLLTILLSFGFTKTMVRFSSRKKSDPAAQQLKLLTYNVNLFGIKRSYRDSSTYARIADFVNRERFDVACMQEFYLHNRVLSEKQLREMLPRLPHAHIHYNVPRKDSRFGIATFSKYPIVNKGSIIFPNTTNAAIYTDIALSEVDTIRVYNVHLQSVRLGDRERDLLHDGGFWSDEKKDRREVLFRASGKLRNAFVQRAQQVDAVSEHMRQSPYAVVVCGDFNDMPISYTYRTMRGNLRDGFMEAGRGIMSTYRSLIPSFRIDYIFYDSYFYAQSYYCPNITYSDHYPLVCKLAKR